MRCLSFLDCDGTRWHFCPIGTPHILAVRGPAEWQPEGMLDGHKAPVQALLLI